MKTLLLPVDFSERSLEAARQAKAIVRHFRSRLIVLNIREGDRRTRYQFEPGGWWGRELEAYLGREFAGMQIEYLSEQGDPTQVIVDQARASAADLIVMAGHPRAAFVAFALGSVTAGLLACAPCPVWLSFHNVRGPAPLLRRILCAVDLSHGCDRVVNWAVGFADALHATCNVIYVSRSSDDHGAPTREGSLPGIDRDAADRIRTKVGSRGQVILSSGELNEVVCSSCVKSGADLLVVGCSGAGNEIDHMHSPSYTLAQQAPCPVIAISRAMPGTSPSPDLTSYEPVPGQADERATVPGLALA